MPDNGVILVVTDAGTHQRELEEAIKKKSAKKNIKIFIAFSPKCLATKLCSDSMPSYNRVSEGRIFNQTDFDSEKFFKSVVYTVRNYSQIEYAIPLLLLLLFKMSQQKSKAPFLMRALRLLVYSFKMKRIFF